MEFLGQSVQWSRRSSTPSRGCFLVPIRCEAKAFLTPSTFSGHVMEEKQPPPFPMYGFGGGSAHSETFENVLEGTSQAS